MNDRINALLAETHNDLRDKLSSAQRDFDRLERLLASRESKDIAELNRAARRLRASGSGDWARTLVEVAAPFSDHAAVFSLRNGSLHLEANRGQAALEDIPLDSAAAFRTAVETKDPVVALRSRAEMSAPIAAYFGESSEAPFRLFPISTCEGVIALLYADGPQANIQADALELLATLTGAVLDSRSAEKPADGLVNISADNGTSDQHRKALRFARVLVAEMRLYQDQHVKNGRTGRDLYASLKPQIDEAREAYRTRFLLSSEATPDYLHQELVHTLANGDVELLGKDYPGPLA